jgi:hypothetical protein
VSTSFHPVPAAAKVLSLSPGSLKNELCGSASANEAAAGSHCFPLCRGKSCGSFNQNVKVGDAIESFSAAQCNEISIPFISAGK